MKNTYTPANPKEKDLCSIKQFEQENEDISGLFFNKDE